MLRRNRRLRTNASIRSLVRETIISPNDFLVPLFIVEGKGIKQEIPSMPNYYRFSLDLLEKEVKELWGLGLKSVLLFVKVPDHLKDNKGTEALNSNGLMQRAIKTIKNVCPEMLVMTDVALDPYSSFGHDGIINEGKIINDDTVSVLAEMSLSHAQAGADFVAPSDMMDGRIFAIRETLETEGFTDIGIMSYSAKYASSFYGPFRDAVGSATNLGGGDKHTYQMDPGNTDEAMREIELDLAEGADMVMIKPGMPYLDIVQRVKSEFGVPTFVYQVSGEYAMLCAASQNGWLDHQGVVHESLLAFKRAGADAILTYFAEEVATALNQGLR